jgi:transposase
MRKRRSFSGRFKAQVVLEVLTGVKSAAQVCREQGIKETLLSRWKQEFIERAPELFERNRSQNQQDERVAAP